MAKKPAQEPVQDKKLAAQENVSAERYQDVFEVDDQAIKLQKVNEIANLLWLPSNVPKESIHRQVRRALELF